MVRTKKHFRPPSPSSSSSSSEEEDEPLNTQPAAVQRGMGKQLHFQGGGKQLSVMGGGFRAGGKQLRMAPQEESEEEEESSSSSSSDELETQPTTTVTYNRSAAGGGKQLRVPGGKQLRPPPAADSDDSEEEEEEEEKPVYSRPAQFSGKAFRGGKQLVLPPTPEEEDDSDSSSEEEEEAPPPTTTVVQRGMGGGKQLRMPQPVEEAKKEESADDMEESEEEEEEEPPPPPKAPTPPPAPKPPTPPPEPEPPKRRGRPPASTSPSRPTRSTRSTKKVIDTSSDESSSEEEFVDMETFDNNKLIKNEEDRKMLDKMPELEREAILAERFEEMKREADMKRAMRDVKRKEKEQKKKSEPKSKAPKKRAPPKKAAKQAVKKAKKEETESSEEEEEDDDEKDEDYEEGAPDTSGDAALAASMSGKRVSTRNLDAKGNKFKRAAALAKIRENRASKDPKKDESDSDLDYGRDSDDSDDDYEEANLKPWQQKGRKTSQLQESSDDDSTDGRRDKDRGKKKEDLDADVEDYALVTVPRRRLIRWCNEPFFEEAVKNCYIRLGIGRDSKTQKACYRLVRIVGVESKKEYSFPPEPNQKPVATNKWLRVTFGKFENVFKMITVSDHRPTVDDVTKYVSQLKTDRQSDNLLVKKKAIKLRKKQDNLVNNYTYTKEDIERLVTEKRKRNKKASNIGLEKTHIAIAVQAARDAVKEAEKRLEDAKIEQMEADDSYVRIAESNVTKATEALEDANALLEERIEEQKRILKDEEDRINRLKGSSKVQNWVKVNQRARLANQNADFLSYKEQLAKEKAEASAEPKFDPFARRKVKPKNLWEVGGKQSDKAADAEEEKKDTHPSERDDANAGKDDTNKRDENAEAQKLDAQSAPFVFEDDINIGDIANLGLGKKKATNRIRKGISLDDYQSRKAAGTL